MNGGLELLLGRRDLITRVCIGFGGEEEGVKLRIGRCYLSRLSLAHWEILYALCVGDQTFKFTIGHEIRAVWEM